MTAISPDSDPDIIVYPGAARFGGKIRRIELTPKEVASDKPATGPEDSTTTLHSVRNLARAGLSYARKFGWEGDDRSTAT